MACACVTLKKFKYDINLKPKQNYVNITALIAKIMVHFNFT